VTSGGTGHCVGESLALGYLKPDAVADGAAVEIEIVGRRRPAVIATAPRLDPNGGRMRA
jgi:dimethylglycine dehydrogenase